MLFEPDEELKAIRARLLSKQQDYRRKQEMARVTGNKTIINVLSLKVQITLVSPHWWQRWQKLLQ